MTSARKLKETVLVAELYVDRLFQLEAQKPAVRELSRFQPVRRDFSLLVPVRVRWTEIDSTLSTLANSGVPELVDWRVREVLPGARAGGATASPATPTGTG